MFVKQGAIDKETKDFLRGEVDRYLVHNEGSDLSSVINEVLNDKDIFTFLAMHSKRGQGLQLGCVSYYDDIRVYVHYGLALDFDHIPRRTKLYQFNSLNERGSFGDQEDLHLGDRIHSKHDGQQPTPEDFVAQVNRVLLNPKPYLIELNLPK